MELLGDRHTWAARMSPGDQSGGTDARGISAILDSTNSTRSSAPLLAVVLLAVVPESRAASQRVELEFRVRRKSVD